MHDHTKDRRRAAMRISIGCLLIAMLSSAGAAQESPWFDHQTEWNGYAQFHFTVADRSAYIVAPKQPAPGKPWVWRARFPDYHAQMDIALLAQGFHIAHVDVAGLFGGPQAIAVGDEFYDYITSKRGLAHKPVLEGVSRGGLLVYNWAANNPSKVACIYCDTPVCDFKSWPGGQGTGLGSASDWQRCLHVYHLTEKQAQAYGRNPVDQARTIAKARIPILHIVSENDHVVPPAENTYLLKSRLEQYGHKMEVISVAEGTDSSHGHHFDHPAADRVVTFIIRHASQ